MIDDPLTRSKFSDLSKTLTMTIAGYHDNVLIGSGDPVEVDSFFGPSKIQTYLERVSPDSPGSGDIWKSFEHYRVFREPNVPYPFYYATGQYVTELDNAGHTWHKVVLGNPYIQCKGFGIENGDIPLQDMPPFVEENVADGSFIPKPPNFVNNYVACVKQILPNIKAEVDTFNFIREFEDLLTIAETVKKLVRFATQGPVKGVLSATRGKTLRQLFHAGSDAYLQLSYGILPTLSDIKALSGQCESAASRFRAKIADAGRLRSRHVTLRFKEFEDLDQTSVPYSVGIYPMPIGAGLFTTRRRTTYDPSTFHVEVQYNFGFTEFQKKHAELLSLLDAMGLDLSPRVIWNWIPWSFVVDWFIGIGQWLDNFRVLNMEPTINIRQQLWSIKRSRNISTSRSLSEGLTNTPWIPYIKDLPVDSARETSFRRSTDVPSMSSAITESGLSLSEFSLGVALGITQYARRHPRKWGV
jgi:hypothetical protein